MENEKITNHIWKSKRKAVTFKAVSFSILFLFIFINFVSAQPPFEQGGSFVEGYQIKIPLVETWKLGQDIEFSFHVFNLSDGMPLDNSSIDCFLHVYNHNGSHIFIGEVLPSESSMINNEWEIILSSGNFSSVGKYSYLIQCNSTEFGGFENVFVSVTRSGSELTTGESYLYIVFLIGNLILFAFFFYWAMTLPYSNEKNEKGHIIRVTKSKYLKLFSIIFAYISFLWLVATISNIALNYIYIDGIKTLALNFYRYATLFQNWIVRVILLVIFIEIWRDIITSRAIKRFGKFIPGKN